MIMSKDQPEDLDRDQWFLPDQKEKYEKYVRGIDDEELLDDNVKAPKIRNELYHHKTDVATAARSAARSEMLQTVERGYVKSDIRLTQREIQEEIPVAIASRKFDFQLGNGPYSIDITENGRTILLGGESGHFASFDWYTGKKFFEINPELEIRDVTFLHDGTASAIATNRSLFTFDKTGVQVHEIQKAKGAYGLQFLPKHWLLVAVTEKNRIVYIDITDGRVIQDAYITFPARKIAQNKSNAVIALGHDRGTVSLWTPNQKEPVAKMMKHHVEVSALDIDMQGNYMAVGHGDGVIQIWDLRQMQVVKNKRSDFAGVSDVAFSATGVLGVARNNFVEMYHDWNQSRAFLTSRYDCMTKQLKFVTFDDFAIVGTAKGVSSVIVPGSGEPNIDSNVANPYETTRWRQEQEVRRLLDKIPAEMISLHPEDVFHVGALVDKRKERANALRKKAIVKEEQKPAEPKKKLSTEKKLAMMKEEYNRLKLEEKMAKKRGEIVDEEPQGPLARFSKEKKKRN